jgi:hypothetical protein
MAMPIIAIETIYHGNGTKKPKNEMRMIGINNE